MWKSFSVGTSGALALLTLAACGESAQPADNAASSLQLQALGAPDIERHEIYGTVCGFRESGGSIRALALIQPEQAWIKLAGEAISIPVREGEGQGPLGIGLSYGNDRAMITLQPDEGAAASGGGRTEVESGITIRTPDGGVSDLSGTLQCSSGSV